MIASYRIHLSPGSRRTSSRSSRSSRGMGSRRGANSGLAPSSSGTLSYPSPDSPPALTSSLTNLPIPPPPLSPPPLEPAHPNGPHGRSLYVQHSPPPDSPPPLAPATLPATMHHQQQSQFIVSRSSNSSSPEGMYHASFSSNMPMNGSSSHSPTIPVPGYSYRAGTSTYQEQATGASGGYTYVHTTPVSSSSSSDYANSAPNPHSLPHINTLNYNSSLSRSGSPHNSSAPVSAAASPLSSVSSRHSISHISHAQSYPPLQSQSSIQSIGHSPSPVSANAHSPQGQMLPSVSALSSSLSNPPTPTTYSNMYSDPSTSSNDNLSQSHHYDNHIVNPPPSTSSSPHSMPAANANYSPALSVQSSGSAGSMPTVAQPLSHHGSNQNILGPSLSRFESPPPVLPPVLAIQGYSTNGNNGHDAQSRMIEERYSSNHGGHSPASVHQRSYSDRYETHSSRGYGNARYSDGSDAYMGHHAPTVPSNAYGGYGGPIGGVSLGHGAWKTESGLGRNMKGIGALVQ